VENRKPKIIRTATVPLSLDLFCRGLFKSLSREYEMVALSSPLPELDRLGEREGVRTIAVPMKRRIAPFSDLVSLVRLIRVFRKEKPDMVHSITPKAGLLSMMAARTAGVPVRVHTFTGLIFPYERGWKRALLRLTDRITAGCATHVIPEGEGVMEDLMNNGVTRKPLHVLGNGNVRGIDLDYYQCTPQMQQRGLELRKMLGIPGKDFAFVYVGRFDRDKGLEELVRAFYRLNSRYPDTHLLMVGEEEKDGKILTDKVRNMMDMHPCIHSSGAWLIDVRPWYAAADALVHPSYREGFPNVVIEAGAMGLASIVTDINGSREIIIEGQNGTIIPPHDWEALYAKMKSFVQDRDMVRSMASNARNLVASRYAQAYVRQCQSDFYKDVLK